MNECSVIVVGAGPAGLGTACALQDAGVNDFVVLERDQIGSSFLKWPAETRFITPSFPARGFGVRDLNAICEDLYPSDRWGEHLSGADYAEYLREVARLRRLPVMNGVDVCRVDRTASGCFSLATQNNDWKCSMLVWAAGEFQYPGPSPFPGAEHAMRSIALSSYRILNGNAYVVIGGFESGVDVACHLVERGAEVMMIDPVPWWEIESDDPSCALSPVSKSRLAHARETSRLKLLADRVDALDRTDRGFRVRLNSGACIETREPPLLATGFGGCLDSIADFLSYSADGAVALTEHDESVATPGLFIAGPMVQKKAQKLCFIYKFHTRQPVIAGEIAARIKGIRTTLQIAH